MDGKTVYHFENTEQIWGWGDKDMREDDFKYVIKSNQQAA